MMTIDQLLFRDRELADAEVGRAVGNERTATGFPSSLTGETGTGPAAFWTSSHSGTNRPAAPRSGGQALA
jgi:hypothetical protein